MGIILSAKVPETLYAHFPMLATCQDSGTNTMVPWRTRAALKHAADTIVLRGAVEAVGMIVVVQKTEKSYDMPSC